MHLTEHITPIGPIAPGSTLTVCDPCYLTDDDDRLTFGHTDALDNHGPFALSAITEEPLAGGNWEAFAIEGELDFWGNRVWRAGIRLVDLPPIVHSVESEQGVDAGMVGFFVNQPRFTYTETWSRDGGLTVMESSRLLFHGTGLAWITDSGLGDGAYPVAAYYRDGQIVAVEAEYLTVEDLTDDDEA